MATLLGLVAAAAAVIALAAGCGGRSSPTQPGVTRSYLGLSANLAANESPSNYLSLLTTVRGTGVNLQYASLQWDTFSPTAGLIDTSSLRALVDGLEGVFGFAVYVNLATIDTNNDRRPLDLRSLEWDDPAVEARLDIAVDALIATLQRPPRRPLVALAIGNEVDAYLAIHPSERSAYQRLLAALGDLVIFTYYPFQTGTDFVHRPTTTLEPDFDAMSARAGARPWALQEAGYTSSPVNGSSGAAQADFVRRFRARVARESRGRLLFANWFLYSDFSSTLVQQLVAYYGGSSPGFAAYLGTLGLRDTLGVEKPSWTSWKQGP